ncbi:MAG: nicotinate-nucleotide adenylyltransferase [Pirellulales bacterium]
MRLGLFGGSFDPVHFGHLRLAEQCRAQARLDEVWLTPSAVQPHKLGGAQASALDRLRMLELAVADIPALSVSRLEIDRGGVSYTVDTLRAIQATHPQADLFLLMGADTLRDLPNWREPTEICRLATPLVVHRVGESPPDFDVLAPLVSADRLARIRALEVEMPAVDISSTEIRERVGRGESIEGMTPQAVVEYVAEYGLYQ